MSKLTVFFIIVFLVLLSMLASFNRTVVDLTVWSGVSYEVPVVALILGSVALGILFMTITVAVRDARRYFLNWQLQRKHKKEERIQETYSKALEAFYAARYEEAGELFMKIMEEDPVHLNALLRLGDIAFQKREFSKANDFYLKAREIKPRSIEILLSLEIVAEAQHKWQEAIKYLDNILDIDGENMKALFKKRDLYERNKKWEELLDIQHKILKCKLSGEEEQRENRNFLGYKYELGSGYFRSGNVDKAIKIFKSIVKTDKNFSAAYLSLSDAYVKVKDTKEAEEILMRGYEATSSIVFLAKLEDLLIEMGEPGAIIDIYQKAVQNNQKDMRLQYFLAKLYYRLEMIDFALETINSMDASAIDYPDFHALVGSVYERRSDYKKAADEFKKALHFDKPLVVPFCCSNCNDTVKDWTGRCPSCKSWNTITLDINESCKTKQKQNRP